MPLGDALLSFEGVALLPGPSIDKMVQELRAALAAAPNPWELARAELALGRAAPVTDDQKRLDAVVAVLKAKMADVTKRLNAVPAGRAFVHVADIQELPLLTSGAQQFDDLLHVFMVRSQGDVVPVGQGTKVRLIYATKIGNDRTESLVPGAAPPPEPVVTFDALGNLQGGLGGGDIAANWIVDPGVELATPTQDTAGATARAKAILSAIRKAAPGQVPLPSTMARATGISPTEVANYLTRGGLTVQEVAFVLGGRLL